MCIWNDFYEDVDVDGTGRVVVVVVSAVVVVVVLASTSTSTIRPLDFTYVTFFSSTSDLSH